MRTLAAALLALLAAVAVVSADTSTAYAERRVSRLVPSPVPAGVVGGAEDDVAWRLEVPEGGVVQVHAASSGTSVFFLRFGPASGPLTGSPLPAAEQSALVGEGAWLVVVDPFAGGAVDITVTFQGLVSDVGGGPARFRLFDLPPGCGCVAGVRLP